MSVLLSAHELTHSYAARPLFSGLTFSIEPGDRIGLIGPNGAGKSTLLKILSGEISPDSGKLSTQRHLRVGLLKQVPDFTPSATLQSTILEGCQGLSPALESWELDALAEALLSKCELTDFGADTPVKKLSGGWKKRVALARELIKQPDLLLLDEPTNHLDVESILWLESLITQAPFASVTITHDRMFLQRIANRILELDPRHEGGLLNVNGDYASYVETRSLLITAQERREIILKNTLRRETEWLRRGAKARTTKQQARIHRAGELQDQVDDLKTRNQTRTVRIEFQLAEKNPKKLIEAKAISKRYGDRIIFSNLNLLITPGTRIGILGKNGIGKSTLLRVLLGREEPTAGLVQHSDQLSVAYFDQIRENLNPELTVAKTLCPVGDFVDYRNSRVHIRSYLDRFLFTQVQMDTVVKKLSGGEQSRILIAKLMLSPANLLVLDEPTNDLDLATLSVLEECLAEFNGAVLLVTHDRYFLDQVASQILAFPFTQSAGKKDLVSFADLQQWEAWHVRESRAADSSARKRPNKNEIPTLALAPNVRKKKLSFKEQRELGSMEEKIKETETRLAQIRNEMDSPDHRGNAVALSRLSQQMAEFEAEIERLYLRWSELEGE